MSELASEDARELVAAVAGEFKGNRKGWLRKASDNSGIKYRTIKSIWYGEITNADHLAIRALRETARRRANTLAGVFESTAHSMVHADADFYLARAVELLHLARALRSQTKS